MEKANLKIGDKVKHVPSEHIITVTKIKREYLIGTVEDNRLRSSAEVKIADCVPYVEPPKEKSPYEIMRERNMEDAKKLPASPKEIGQHILWLKMAVIDRVEKIENLTNDKICTFRTGKDGDENYKFGFTEHYVNLLMHYAYEAGKKNATDSLTRHFEVTTRDMKTAVDSIIKALDDNGLLPYED